MSRKPDGLKPKVKKSIKLEPFFIELIEKVYHGQFSPGVEYIIHFWANTAHGRVYKKYLKKLEKNK